MKKSEVKTASNEDLIINLVGMVCSTRILKSHINRARWVCEELASRNVVEDASSLMKKWERLYNW